MIIVRLPDSGTFSPIHCLQSDFRLAKMAQIYNCRLRAFKRFHRFTDCRLLSSSAIHEMRHSFFFCYSAEIVCTHLVREGWQFNIRQNNTLSVVSKNFILIYFIFGLSHLTTRLYYFFFVNTLLLLFLFRIIKFLSFPPFTPPIIPHSFNCDDINGKHI